MFLRKLLAFTVVLAGLLPSVSRAALFKDPVVINAAVGKALTLDMHSLLINPQLANVVISSTGDMPGWMHLNTSTFVLTGTPGPGDGGTFTIHFNAVVNEAGDLNHPATLNVLGPPIWKQNPLNLGKQTEGVPFSHDLNSDITNPGGGQVTFTFSGTMPNWLHLDPSGALSGTPSRADVGKYSGFSFTVTSGATGLSSSVPVVGEVLIHLKPPSWTGNPITLSNASEGVPYTRDLNSFVNNPEGGPLTFNLQGTVPAWIQISPSGVLSGTPHFPDVGSVSITAHVSSKVDGVVLDGGTTQLVFQVIHVVYPPVWTTPIHITVNEDTPMQESLLPFIMDPSGFPLSFTQISGPAWATLSPSGIYTGKPSVPQEGDNVFQVHADNGHGGTADAPVTITVLHVNHPPFWTQNPIILPNAPEGSPYTQSVASFAKDPDAGDTLTFSKVAGPAWAVVTADGNVQGQPSRPDIGANTFILRVTDAGGLHADVTVKITVDKVHQPPQWLKNPISLPDATVGKAYTQRIDAFAKAFDGATLTFSKVSGPTWAFVTQSGLVIGTPAAGDVGQGTYVLRATDSQGASADVTVLITVDSVPPPHWTQDPIPLGTATVAVPFQFNLAPFAVSPSGAPLTYQILTGPTWLQVNPSTGMLSGTPATKDLGDYTAVFQISDGLGGTAQAGGFGTVVQPSGPVFVPGAMVFTVKERDTLDVNLNQPQFVTDPAGRPMTFQLLNGDPWVTLSSAGALEAKPLHPQLGDHTYTVQATDDQGRSAQAPLVIHVIRSAQPPVWSQNPIRFTTKINQPFSATIADKASDPDGVPLTFSKTAGPGWLTVSSGGQLSGTPTTLGDNTFTVTARNDALGTDVTVIITVISDSPIVDNTQVDSAVPGAPAENLWVIDSSFHNWSMDGALNSAMVSYYSALSAAQIHSSAIYIASSADKWHGDPVPSKTGAPLMLWSDSDLAGDFKNRTNDAYVLLNCCNSPTWAMQLFYNQLPSASFYHNNYMVPGVPMDVLIATNAADNFTHYISGTPQAGFSAADFAHEFTQIHQKEPKPYRISAIASGSCTEDGQGHPVSADSTYQTLTAQTGGKLYPTNAVAADIQDFAQQVIFRAYVYAKHRIKLSHTPIDPKGITVSIGTTQLTGNTGASTDQWSYDGSTNEVVLNWQNIPFSIVHPGDMISIKYQGT